jgi:hypothetical protein
MLFGGTQSREEIMAILQRDEKALDNVIAMANVGAAFSAISVFEDLVGALILASKAELKTKLDATAVSAADLFMERHQEVKGSTLGRLVTVLEESGIAGRDIAYLRAILGLRNEFVHHLMQQVPLPGDWERYGYSLEMFSNYTRRVMRHIHFATSCFSRIMYRHGLLGGKFGDFGSLLWNPEGPLLNSDSEV